MRLSRLRTVWQRLMAAKLDTTSAGVELAVVRVFAGLRAVNLIQLWLAISGLLGDSPRPGLDLTLVLAWTAWSLVAVTWALRAGRVSVAWLLRAEVVAALVILAGAPLVTTAATRVDTWHNWAHPVSLSTALIVGSAGVGARRVAAVTALLAGTYLATTLPGVIGRDDQWTVLTNAVAYVAFAVIGAALSGFLRRLGADADTQRARAAELGQRAGAEGEFERHRELLHDHAALLAIIGNDDGLDPTRSSALRAEALRGARVVSTFIASTAGPPPAGNGLDVVVAHAAGAFPELPMTVNLATASGIELSDEHAHTLRVAVGTLLTNVRAHAAASDVTVHAGAAGSGWEVVVRDDGIGFDPAATSHGFGLSRLVHGRCRQHGIDVEVDSAPGEGTVVTLTHAGS